MAMKAPSLSVIVLAELLFDGSSGVELSAVKAGFEREGWKAEEKAFHHTQQPNPFEPPQVGSVPVVEVTDTEGKISALVFTERILFSKAGTELEPACPSELVAIASVAIRELKVEQVRQIRLRVQCEFEFQPGPIVISALFTLLPRQEGGLARPYSGFHFAIRSDEPPHWFETVELVGFPGPEGEGKKIGLNAESNRITVLEADSCGTCLHEAWSRAVKFAALGTTSNFRSLLGWEAR